MTLFGDFFQIDTPPNLLVVGNYDPWLVLLSIVVAMFASSMALQIVGQGANISNRTTRFLTLVGGSVALGCGVFSMHFVAMLSFDLCTTVSYDRSITLLSTVPSLVASGIAFYFMSRHHATMKQLAVAGALVGAGIGAMHYTGMAAMQMSVLLRYDPWFFSLSIVVAVVLATAALWIRYGLENFSSKLGKRWAILIGGCVMGLAISAMHYTGMAAARFITTPATVLTRNDTDPSFLALSVSFITIAFSGLVFALNALLKYRDVVINLRSSESRLRAIVSTAMDGVVIINLEGTIQEFNASAERMFGYDRREVTGKNIRILMPEPFHSNHDTYIANYLRTGIAKIIGIGREASGLRKDGSVFPIHLSIGHVRLPTEHLFVGFVSDISEMKLMSRDQEKFRFLSEFSSDAHLIFDETGIIECNPAAIQILGAASRAELIGLHPARFSPERQPDGMLSSEKSIIMDGLARRNGFHQFEWIHQRLDGQEFPVEVTLKPIDIDGKWAIVVVWHDLTQAKALAAGLLKARDDAQAASKSKSNFLATMSHEIRTPMNSIIGFTEVLLGGDVSSRHRTHLEIVRNSAKSLLRILNDILDTAKLEQGAIEIEKINFSLFELLDQLMSTMGLEAKTKGLALTMVRDPAIGEYYVGDPLRIRQVLINILGNSIKFTDRGKVTLSVFPDDGNVHFQIEDTGIGIPGDRLEKIFEPFTQADPSMTRRFGGTGLGTNISRQLTEIMGGRIWAESQLERGSIFHILLPLSKGEPVEKTEGATNIHLPHLRILIVDDVKQNVELIALLFEEHAVSTASNGAEAIRAAATQRFDLILMDVQMPGMDGLEATRLIRADEKKQGIPSVPIIALSASVFQEDRIAAAEAGMNGFVSKPIEMDVLAEEIARVLHLHPLASDFGIRSLSPNDDLDLTRGLKLFGSKERYLEAIEIFLREHSVSVAQTSVEFSSRGMERMLSTLHMLRGVGGNLGAQRFAKAAEDLENFLRSGGPGRIETYWQAVQDAFFRARSILIEFQESAIPDRDKPAVEPVTSVLNADAAVSQARILFESLGRGAIDDSELKKFFYLFEGHANPSTLGALRLSIARFDFDKARSLVSSLADAMNARTAGRSEL